MVHSFAPVVEASNGPAPIRFPQAMASVIVCTLVSGVLGGWVGAALARLAPSFLRWIHSPSGNVDFQPDQFGLGLGAACGLVMGAAAGSFVMCVLALRDAWLVRPRIAVSKPAASPGMLD